MKNAPLQARSLGRYQLLFMLGQGGMGEVHLAKLTGAAGFEKLCIVKTILPQMQADQQFVDRFHHEARVLVQLNHSNIAQVYDMGEVDGTLYMAIEYVPGVDLSRVESRVKRQQVAMPVPVALYLAQQVTEALGYAHRKTGPDGISLGIVHRDVSPQNVMVSYEGEVKVIDFGLAKSAARSQHTLPQTVMGKLGYMSPEQAMAKSVDFRSDIFSAGIVVWEMLAGRPLYGGGTMGEMLAQMAYPNIPSLRSVRPEISPTLEQIVMRALQTDPMGRYARGDDFARALNELAVREALTIGAEDVGNYVRAMCPEEFAAERQLQSKLSIMRKKGNVAAEEVPIDAPGTEGTFLKPSQAALATAKEMTPAQRALSVVEAAPPDDDPTPAPADPNPGRGRTVVKPTSQGKPAAGAQPAAAPPQGRGRTVVAPQKPRPAPAAQAAPPPDDGLDEPLVVPKSKGPLIVAVLALLAVAGGAAWFFVGDGGKADVPKGDKPVVADAPPVTPPPDPVKETPVPDAGVVAEVPVKPAVKVATLGMVDVVGVPRLVSVEDDRAELILKRDEKDTFREGDAVLIVGESEDGKQVPLYARATVTLATPTLVKAGANEGTLPTTVKAYLMKDKGTTRPTIARRDPVTPTRKDPVEPVKNDPPPKKDPVVAVKNDPPPKKDPVVEPVKNDPPPKKDPVVKVDPPPPTPKAEPTGAPVVLKGAVGVASAAGGQLIRVQNQSGHVLTNCSVRLTNNRTASVATLGATEVQLRYADFRPDPRPADPQAAKGWSSVVCREGSGYFWTTWLR